jgi:hypothetical protein
MTREKENPPLRPKFNRALRKRVIELITAIEVCDLDKIEQLLTSDPHVVTGCGNFFPLIEASKRFMPHVLMLAFKNYHPTEEGEKFEFAELARRAEEEASFAWMDYFNRTKEFNQAVYGRYGETLKFCRKISELSPPLKYRG